MCGQVDDVPVDFQGAWRRVVLRWDVLDPGHVVQILFWFTF